MTTAIQKLINAQQSKNSLLCVGLEPSPEYQPRGMAANLQGYEEFLRFVIEATEEYACAYKVNLAFFESLGWEGMELLYAVRENIPEEALLIADGKRGDIGSTAKHYAAAIYDQLEADAATINPLMGLDSAEPFLAHSDKLNYFLVLTSNPSAEDFLLRNALYRDIASKLVEWNYSNNIGFVVGATWPERMGELRAIAPEVPFLVPGIGAQGGELAKAFESGAARGANPHLLFNVTRGILPRPEDKGDPAEIVRTHARKWRDAIQENQGRRS